MTVNRAIPKAPAAEPIASELGAERASMSQSNPVMRRWL